LPDDEDGVALVREPTDLGIAEEDVIIDGGTGENVVLNGIYFKLNGTYGLDIYKLVKRGEGMLGSHSQRYLYRDPKSATWIVSPKAWGGIVSASGCAFAEEEEGDPRPGAITKDWYVWHPATMSMKYPGDDEEEDEPTNIRSSKFTTFTSKKPVPIDKVTSRTVVGFEVMGATGKLSPALMLRHPSEFFGRPVYEAEQGQQFLYWMKKDGTIRQGYGGEDSVSREPATLFAFPGYWIIAKNVGEPPRGPNCFAFVEDLGVTPDQIDAQTNWQVATSMGNDKDKGPTFEASQTLRLVLQEWSPTGALDNFDDAHANREDTFNSDALDAEQDPLLQ